MPAALLIRILFWLWLGSALAATHFRLLHRLPPAALAALIFSIAGLAVIAGMRIRPLRDWLASLDLRSLVLLHLARYVGIYFLILHHRGVLPREFALPAGIGHIIIATMTLPIAFAPLTESQRLRAISIWNVVGFMDIILIVVAMVRVNLAAPLQLLSLAQLPLSLVPTFLMPVFLASHVIIHIRVTQAQRA